MNLERAEDVLKAAHKMCGNGPGCQTSERVQNALLAIQIVTIEAQTNAINRTLDAINRTLVDNG